MVCKPFGFEQKGELINNYELQISYELYEFHIRIFVRLLFAIRI
jgi:hypothetical protein